MLFLAIGMYLVIFDLIKKNKKKIGAGENFGEGGPEKQLFYHGLTPHVSDHMHG